MKKVLIMMLLTLFTSSSQAQLIRGYGLKFGATISNQIWEYSPPLNIDHENRVGLNAGVFAEFLNIPSFSIVTEVNYIQKGMKQDVLITTTANPDGTGDFITWDNRIDYINFSVIGKLRFNYGVIHPYIIVGPKFDKEVNKKNSLGVPDAVQENFKKNRLGYRIGIGTEIQLLTFSLLAEFLYDADFNAIFKNQFLEVNSSSIDFRVGIML